MSSVQTDASRRLNRERVLSAALDVVDAEGLPALTMRRLAAELGVGVMSLYRYVATKSDLLDGVIHLALEPLTEVPSESGSWDEKLTAAIRDLYAALRAHPGATQILADGLIPGPALDPVRNSLLGCLRDAGFDNSRAVTYLHTLFTYVVGFAVVAGHNEVPSEAEASRIGALPPESFGHLAGAAQEFSRRFSQRSFDAGLALIIAGLRAELAQA